MENLFIKVHFEFKNNEWHWLATRQGGNVLVSNRGFADIDAAFRNFEIRTHGERSQKVFPNTHMD